MFSAAAPAKINLALHITGRRADGYHLLSSLIVFADIGDRLSVAPVEGLSLTVTGPFADFLLGPEEHNLVYKAAQRLRSDAGVSTGAAITLDKHLPVAAGIGGGSADAAAAAWLLNRLWGLGLTSRQLTDILLPLGADIPTCLEGRTTLIEGIGEAMTPIDRFGPYPAVLVNPGIAVPTAEVFRQYRCSAAPFSAPLILPREETPDWRSWLAHMDNDLTSPACTLFPEIRHVLQRIEHTPGCLLARMSGSGATCVGLYATNEGATVAAEALSRLYPHGWVRPTLLGGAEPLNLR